MQKFLTKIVLVLSPLILIFISVLIIDPYKILYDYEDYSYKTFPVNRDYISTQYFIENYDQYQYDSYIFGNSRSSAFLTNHWADVVEDSIVPYHFDASSESLFGINKKCIYLDSIGVPIKHAVILLEQGTLMQTENRDYHVFTKHYALTGQSKWSFYMVFLKSMTHKHFFKFYLDYLLGGAITDMAKRIPRDMECKPVTNDYLFSGCKEALSKMGEDEYYRVYGGYFKERNETPIHGEPVIFERQKELLKEIKKVFDHKETQYQIIISPSYDQKLFNSKDLGYLKMLFGEQNVHDYSGKNKFTENIRNYYDGSHYKPSVGKEILEEIYSH